MIESVELPYKYVRIPLENEEKIEREEKLKVCVNKVITNLSRDVFAHCGFEIVEDCMKCNTTWGRQYEIHAYSTFKGWQKVNHFAGANMMGRKDNLHLRMIELSQRISNEEIFYPESYLVPREIDDLKKVWDTKRCWILKPAASSKGEGIKVVCSKDQQCDFNESVVVQTYIEKPFLITGRKFDIRLYILVTSAAPLRIYMHDSGLIRFATQPYDPFAPVSNVHVHLTNFSLNKDDEGFVHCMSEEEHIEDSKWSIPFFKQYMNSIGVNVDQLFENLERVSIGTIIAGFSTIRTHHNNHVKGRHTSYELYGIDIILDENLKPHVLEINISPGMSGTDSPLDYNIKNRLMHDTLRMARIIDCNSLLKDPCPGIEKIDYECKVSISKDRTRRVENNTENPWDNPVFADYMIIRDILEEKRIVGGFRRVFPKKKSLKKFYHYFDRMKYHDIVLTKWIEMPKEERRIALDKNIHHFCSKIESFI